MKIDPVRRLAWSVLVTVSEGGDLDAELEAAQASLVVPRDRAFLARLVRGTIQWQARYDHLIGLFSRRESPHDPRVLNLLRMGLHQMLAMDGVPDFAAIDQTVAVARAVGETRRSGFVNGVLRNLQRRLTPQGGDAPGGPDRIEEMFSSLASDPAGWVSAWYSHPRWLVEDWLRRFGRAATEDLCAFNNRPVPLDFCVLPGEDPETVTASLAVDGSREVEQVAAGTLRVSPRPGRGTIRQLLDEHPRLIVQDATVQDATRWLASGLDDLPDSPWVLDMCAAPGGKSVHLAALLAPGRNLLAMEPDDRRMQLLRGTVTRVGPLPLVRGDGLRPPLAPGSCAAVLLDGPCSGTGVLRRHPEARWRLQPALVRTKARLLGDLARRAVELLAPGGVLLYATCSLQEEENQAVVDGLLRVVPGLETVADEDGAWQKVWLPPEAPGDGFFAARLRRKRETHA